MESNSATAIATERVKTLRATTAIATASSEEIFNSLSDLVNEQFKAWYCGRFNRLGTVKVMELAKQARSKGDNTQRYFSYLLKVRT